MQRCQSCVIGKLLKVPVMWRDVGKSVEGGFRVEVKGVESVRQNRVSPDRTPCNAWRCVEMIGDDC